LNQAIPGSIWPACIFCGVAERAVDALVWVGEGYCMGTGESRPSRGRSRAGTIDLAHAFRTPLGSLYRTSIEKFVDSRAGLNLRGQVQLILTSPPFPLNNKKSYGNLSGVEYVKWIAGLAKPLSDLLREDGSIIIEIGNAWEPGRPVQSVLHLKALL